MKKRGQPEAKKSNAAGRKKTYSTPKLVSYGDFRRVTLSIKGSIDKDSGGSPIRTRVSGGGNV